MALTKSAQTPHASSSNTAGGTTIGSGGWLPINYGVSIGVTITNGGTGPTVGCDFVVEVAQDSSGTNSHEFSRQTAGTTASTSYPFNVGMGVGGGGGDWSHYRVKFTGNTGQAVTVLADAMTTTAL